MQTRVTVEEIHAAARQLAKSGPGREGMKQLLDLFRDEGIRLGLLDRAALAALLQAAWDGHSAEVREAITRALLAQDAMRST